MDKLTEIQKLLKYKFKNINLLKEAITHKSIKSSINNERLEFLGDAVLDLIVGEYLYHKFKGKSEGDLSKLRASLVNEDSLAKIAKELNRPINTILNEIRRGMTTQIKQGKYGTMSRKSTN